MSLIRSAFTRAPSAMIVQLASRFRSRVSLTFNGHTANGRSIVAVMLLAGGAWGPPSPWKQLVRMKREAIDALVELISGRFEKLPVT